MVHAPLSMNQCHLYAQKLNNSAALCIEIGQYDRAVLSLTKALRLSREQTDESMICTCRCRDCSLDGCIAYSECNPPVSKISQQGSSGCCSFVYRRPIRVPPQPILESHNMGRSLFLVITFNLGLAHHLSAMVTSQMTNPIISSEEITTNEPQEQRDQEQPKPRNDTKLIKKALQLYELSNNWHSRITASRPLTVYDCDATGGVSSIRFRMILSNNMSHAHSLSSNDTKYRQCLENLLSTVMVAVEYRARTKHNSGSLGDDSESSSSSSDEDLLSTTNVEGFLMNASRLFLNGMCADAA